MKVSSNPRAENPPATTVAKGWKTLGIALLPGLLLTTGIAGTAIFIGQAVDLESLNPLLISVLMGIGWRQAAGPLNLTQPGVKFAMKRILRLAVILLGLRLSLAEVMAVGPVGLIIVATSTVSTFYFTCWLGNKLKIGRRLTQLIAAGTAICGASAVVATNAVVDGSEEDMAYAISTITGFGTLAMLTYPVISNLLALTPEAFGIWSGASVHEVAQVIATAFQAGPVSGKIATVTKLSRVLLIIPIMLSLGWQSRRSMNSPNATKSLHTPWFVVLFGLLTLINSFGIVSETIRASILHLNQLLLCMALAAMGLETNLNQLLKIGTKPLYLAGIAWIFLAVVSLSMISMFYPSL
jgi:uncharacterized integral membrane protein (TIGR00698 family)